MKFAPLTAPKSPRLTPTFRKVVNFISAYQVLDSGERLIVAVSGGPDSTALALLLSPLRKINSLHLHIAHFDHRLRSPEEATADREFVRDLAGKLDIPFSSGRGETRKYASKHRLSIEDAARRLRYAFLADEARSLNPPATVIATGHTGNDQAETIILHLIRGTGLDGLRGMLPRAQWPFGDGPSLARPLLYLNRDDTESYCREAGFKPRLDPTNLSTDATRNRVRHELLPLMREINPRVDDALIRLASIAADEAEHIERHAEAVWPTVISRQTEDEICFRRTFFPSEPALAARLLTKAVRLLAGTYSDLQSVHIRDILLLRPKRRWRLSLPWDLTAVGGASNLCIRKGTVNATASLPPVTLAVPGRVQTGGRVVEGKIVEPPNNPRLVGSMEAFLDANKAGTSLTIRSRRPGDRLRPLGLGGEKKLQDILVDAKVPASERDGVPLVCTGDNIVWVAGHCIDERYALDIDSRQALHLVATLSDTDSQQLAEN